MAKGYDIKCYELAKAFLADEPELETHADCDAIAQAIQDCIEDEIADRKSRLHPKLVKP